MVEVSSGGTVTIGCNGCIPNPPDNPAISIDCTPASGDGLFFYTWFCHEDGNDTILEGETGSSLTVTEEGEYICNVRNSDRAFPAISTTTIRSKFIRNCFHLEMRVLSRLLPNK